VAHTNPYSPDFLARLHAMQSLFQTRAGPVEAHQQALALTYNTVQQQATLLAYIDNFRWLALVSAACLVGAFFFKKVSQQRPGMAH
jgi:DHA2 family multidrug resistance protein